MQIYHGQSTSRKAYVAFHGVKCHVSDYPNIASTIDFTSRAKGDTIKDFHRGSNGDTKIHHLNRTQIFPTSNPAGEWFSINQLERLPKTWVFHDWQFRADRQRLPAEFAIDDSVVKSK